MDDVLWWVQAVSRSLQQVITNIDINIRLKYYAYHCHRYAKARKVNLVISDHRYTFTGASGVLGSAVYNAFIASGHTVLGLANSRATGDLIKLDLLDKQEVSKVFSDFKADCEHSSCLRQATAKET